MNENLETITPRQLRTILFYLNDDMTVKELRAALYDAPDMDGQFNISWALLERMLAGKVDEVEATE